MAFQDEIVAAGEELKAARRNLDEVREKVKQVALTALEHGAPETLVARQIGVDRMTIRSWRGK